jgi:predicted enzyme related to lactoylglutathione lyase
MISLELAGITPKENPMPNPVVHFEVVGADADKTQQFYSQTFGWQINADNPMKYGIVDTGTPGRGIAGGVAGGMPGGEARVTFYIEVADIDQTLSQIIQSGGKVLMPKSPVPGGPTIALFADPSGNCVGLTQAN